MCFTGITLISLQLSFKIASLAYTPIYTKVYQATLDWFPGFVFTLSSIITVLATIPVRYVMTSSVLATIPVRYDMTSSVLATIPVRYDLRSSVLGALRDRDDLRS